MHSPGVGGGGGSVRAALSTLDAPVYEESPWAVSDVVEPAVLAVLQDTHEQECPQPAGRTMFQAVVKVNPRDY